MIADQSSATPPPPSAQRVSIPSKRPARSLESVDFLRGLMAATVLFSHVILLTNGLGQLSFVCGLATLAVDVFMFISGFLMMLHFCERQQVEPWERPRTWMIFYIRRFFRIAPLYYCALALALCFQAQFLDLVAQNNAVLPNPVRSGPYDPTDRSLTLANILSHVTFAFGAIPRFAANNQLPDWSIGLEMQFYLAFPFIALLLVRTQFWKGTLLLMGLSWLSLQLFGVGIADQPKALGVFPMASFLPLRIDCFLAGILVSAGLYEDKSSIRRTVLVLMGLGVAALYMKRFFIMCFAFAVYELVSTHGSGFASLDAGVRLVGRLIRARLFKWMADASYGVYLLHTLILTPLIWLLVKTGRFVGLAPALRFLICALIAVPLVYLAAAAFHVLVEQPGIALGKRIIKRLR
jgi:peptidoglycan/LPS O-acetylase OafA/YrhL